MAKNKLEDLRDHLFSALERLNDETINPELMKLEIQKAKMISEVGTTLIDAAKVEIDFLKATQQLSSESDFFQNIQPKMLNGEK